MKRQLTLFGRQFKAPPLDDEAARTAYSVWSWSMFVAVAIGGFGVQLPIAVANRDDKTRARPGRLLRDLAVIIAGANPLWDFRVHGDLGDYRPGKTVVVANHVSNSDAFLISHLPWEMKWLGKASLFKIPVIGWLMALAGDVPVKRGTKGSIIEAMELCREHLQRGMPIMIFPEGTRSGSGELLNFKDGAFRLAIESGAEVLPVAVAGTRSALPKHSWKFGFSRGLVSVGKPISTEGMGLDDVEALKAAAREQIEALYAEIEPLTQLDVDSASPSG
jgi:1-acyl-sn-glycerol-3-phosphate acyltransferase